MESQMSRLGTWTSPPHADDVAWAACRCASSPQQQEVAGALCPPCALELETRIGSTMSSVYWALWALVQAQQSRIRFGYAQHAAARLRAFAAHKARVLQLQAARGAKATATARALRPLRRSWAQGPDTAQMLAEL
jgi:hypothetical protein